MNISEQKKYLTDRSKNMLLLYYLMEAGINRGHPCLWLAAIFAGMLYNVQIIQKSSTWNIMHVSIIVLELPAKLQWVID